MDIRIAFMAVLRITFGLISLVAGLLMLKKDIAFAVRANGIIGSIGPFIFLSVSALGIAGLSSSLNPVNLMMLLTGIGFVFWGTRC
ncbi:MAG: DUF2619 domain-containing protein [Clostridiales bacterium]|jgi:hypothetical protein|nr:DUF2619 domain-containing protein [Clostridiales bacterium]